MDYSGSGRRSCALLDARRLTEPRGPCTAAHHRAPTVRPASKRASVPCRTGTQECRCRSGRCDRGCPTWRWVACPCPSWTPQTRSYQGTWCTANDQLCLGEGGGEGGEFACQEGRQGGLGSPQRTDTDETGTRAQHRHWRISHQSRWDPRPTWRHGTEDDVSNGLAPALTRVPYPQHAPHGSQVPGHRHVHWSSRHDHNNHRPSRSRRNLLNQQRLVAWQGDVIPVVALALNALSQSKRREGREEMCLLHVLCVRGGNACHGD
jgi:hypothetical protein